MDKKVINVVLKDTSSLEKIKRRHTIKTNSGGIRHAIEKHEELMELIDKLQVLIADKDTQLNFVLEQLEEKNAFIKKLKEINTYLQK